MPDPDRLNPDRFNLHRFIEAQDPVLADVRAELKNGAKVSHWIWFIFPQLGGLGTSSMSKKFAITSREEASAYLNHPILGQRLKECTRLVLAVEGKSGAEIFGPIDDMKFRSCMTLFSQVSDDDSPDDQIFNEAIQKFFGGIPDHMTLKLLR